jgi:hypothetical protein
MNGIERIWVSGTRAKRAIVSGARTWWRDWSRALALIVLAVSLGGCVDYDIGIDFRSQTEGAIVQHVRVADRLSALDRDTVRSWTDSLTRRAKDLGGYVRQRRDGDLDVTIPFINGDDLAKKFDQFFGATETELFVVPEANPGNGDEPPKIASNLSIVQHNFLLAIRNDLVLDFDLRGLSLLSNLGRSPFQTDSSQSFIDLRFHLTTPWGMALRSTGQTPDLAVETQGRDRVWTLKPGEMQHIEASFWIPSPIGIGALAVIGLTAIGSTIKHRVFAKFWPKTHAV